MPEIEVMLVTGRTIDQGTTKERGKLSDEYREKVAICELNPKLLKELGVKENSNIKIATEFGEVVVKGRSSNRTVNWKVVYMPYGLWANVVVNPQTHGTGMPSFKGIKARIKPALQENVSSVQELLKQTFKGE